MGRSRKRAAHASPRARPGELPEAELRAFLAAVRSAPDDDAPRLIFADWLEDHGDPRGEMIRLSCEFAAPDTPAPRRQELEERLRDWGFDGRLLGGWVGKELTAPEAFSVGVCRGLLTVHAGDEDVCYGDRWPRFVAAVEQGWLGQAHVGGYRGRIDDLAAGRCPLLARALEMEVYRWDSQTRFGALQDADLATLARVPNVVGLDLDDESFTDVGLEGLRGNRTIKRLRLRGRFSRRGLAAVETLGQLQELHIEGVEGQMDAAASQLRESLPGCRVRLERWRAEP